MVQLRQCDSYEPVALIELSTVFQGGRPSNYPRSPNFPGNLIMTNRSLSRGACHAD